MDMENPTGQTLFSTDPSSINEIKEASNTPNKSHNMSDLNQQMKLDDFTSDDLANDGSNNNPNQNGTDADDYDCDNENNNGSGNIENIDYSNNENDENSDGQTNKRHASDFSDNQSMQQNNYQKRQKTGMNNMSGNQNQNMNNNRNYTRKEGSIELRILLPSKDAGAIIGRGGANIKKLRQEHKTQIQVPDCNGPERLLLISGDLDTCISALLDVIPLVEENQKFNNIEREATELRLLVHQSQAGCIIGRGGDKIKELRIKHNLDMKVYSECAPMSTERVCQMKGKSPDIVLCLREVIALLESAPPKGMSRPYDPHNFDEFLASQYGGFCSDKRQGGMQGGRGMQGGGPNNFQQRNNNFNQSNNNESMNNRSGGGFQRNNSGDSNGNGYNNGGYNNNGMSRGGHDYRGGMRGGRGGGGDRGGRGGGFGDRGGRSGSGGSYGDRGGSRGGSRGGGFSDRGGRGGFNNDRNNRPGFNNNRGGYNDNQQQPQHHQPQTQQHQNSFSQPGSSAPLPGSQTNQVTIPNELAGAVIGPKGAKIQQIRDQSGAGITIDKPVPGSNDRIITIQGTSEQIQNAQYLLQVTVKQSGLWQGQ